MNKEKTKFYWNLSVLIMGLIGVSIRIIDVYKNTWVSDRFHWGTLIGCSFGVISSYAVLRKYF